MATSYHLPKKRSALKGTRISFLRDAFRRGLSQYDDPGKPMKQTSFTVKNLEGNLPEK